MKIIKTNFKDCYIIEPIIFEDGRGFFYEKFNQKKFLEETGLNIVFVQENVSKSSYGVVRGIHLQKGDFAQSKLVSCLKGKILDVVVDLRRNSATFGQVFTIELSEENQKQIFIPKGFGHGFSVLSEEAIICYKCDNFYEKNSEGGIIYNDKILNIDWRIPSEKIILSEKDKKQLTFEEGNF